MACCVRREAREVFARPLGGSRWQPTGFRSRADLRRDLARAGFLWLRFGRRDVWLISPGGLPFELVIVRRRRKTAPL